MNKKSILGLILFSCLTITGMFVGADYLISQGEKIGVGQNQSYTAEDDQNNKEASENSKGYHLATQDSSNKNASTDKDILSDKEVIPNKEVTPDKNASSKEDNRSDKSSSTDKSNSTDESNSTDNSNLTDNSLFTDINEGTNEKVTVDEESSKEELTITSSSVNLSKEEPWLAANPSDTGGDIAEKSGQNTSDTKEALGKQVKVAPDLELINSDHKTYQDYIPEMVIDSAIETALDINNPSLNLKAEAAILFDVKTKKVLYHKNAVEAKMPASTAKLLTSLLALEWCKESEEVTVGPEVKMIATDSSKANIHEGEILTIRNLLEGMLLPSGNDAAYAVATHVGRKSLQDPNASCKEAVIEFAKLMNQKAKELGVKNSNFKSPDGYDALGQYTTAYDMGIIGLAALENNTIREITKKVRSRNIFVSGRDVTFENTNSLLNSSRAAYYSHAIGLKTGTSGLAGKCLVAAAEYKGREVLCVVLKSNSSGRWEDAKTLLSYGLK